MYNTGLLQSLLCKRNEVFMIPWTFKQLIHFLNILEQFTYISFTCARQVKIARPLGLHYTARPSGLHYYHHVGFV